MQSDSKNDKVMYRIAILNANMDVNMLVIRVGNTEHEDYCLNYCYRKDVTDICKLHYSESPAFSEDERQKMMSR